MNTRLFVSDVVSLDELSIKDFNLIKAPTGSGKTYFCINKLSELTKSKGKILYLCPTTMLLNQLVTQNKENVRLYDPDFDDVEKWSLVDFETELERWEQRDTERIIAMTYEKLGNLILAERAIMLKRSFQEGGGLHSEDYCDFTEMFDVIVCDEFHDYDWRIDNDRAKLKKRISKDKAFLKNDAAALEFEVNAALYENNKITAFDAIYSSIGSRYVVGISATPDCNFLERVAEANKLNEIKSCSLLKKIFIKNRIETSNLRNWIAKIPLDKKVLLYTPRITEELKYADFAIKCGRKPEEVGVYWSTNNKDHPMTKEQLDEVKWILEKECFPEGKTFICINKALEMGINLKTEIDYAMIDVPYDKYNADGTLCTEEELKKKLKKREATIDQASARTRQEELDYLIVSNKYAPEEDFVLPKKFIGVPLGKEEKNELCELMNLRGKDGALLKWTSVKKELISKGLKIEDKRKTVDGKKISVSIINV